MGEIVDFTFGHFEGTEDSEPLFHLIAGKSGEVEVLEPQHSEHMTCSPVVLGDGYPLEIVSRPVEDVAVNVVDDVVGAGLGAKPRESHEKVETLTSEVRMDLRIARVACDAIVVSFRRDHAGGGSRSDDGRRRLKWILLK